MQELSPFSEISLYVLLGIMGFMLAGVLGLWLIFGIMRSGRL